MWFLNDFSPRLVRLIYIMALSSIGNGLMLVVLIDSVTRGQGLSIALLTKVVYLILSCAVWVVSILVFINLYEAITLDPPEENKKKHVKSFLVASGLSCFAAIVNIITACYLVVL